MIIPQHTQEWVKLYLEHIREISPEVHVAKEEGYKFKSVEVFQKNFDLGAADLRGMLERAIEFNNLTMGQQYLPRRALLVMAKDYETETRSALEEFLNESRPVFERIDRAKATFDAIWAKRNVARGEAKITYIGHRFLSLLLAFRLPEKYNPIKPTEWTTFCRFVDSDFFKPNGLSDGQKYQLYQPYIEALRSVIRNVPEIESLHEKLTAGLAFRDSEYRWMAQDVIYVTARYIEKEGDEKTNQESPSAAAVPEEDEGCEPQIAGERFSKEEYLEAFVGENLESLLLGHKLTLYRDETGRSGLYYPTNAVGEIDVLALDEMSNYVVIELKVDYAKDSAAAQLGRYMQWVEEKLASKTGKTVRGIIIAHRGRQSLLSSVKALRFPVSVKLYKIGLTLTELT